MPVGTRAVAVEAPGRVGDRQVVGHRCRCRRNRSRSARSPVAEHQHVVGEQVGVDDRAAAGRAASRAASVAPARIDQRGSAGSIARERRRRRNRASVRASRARPERVGARGRRNPARPGASRPAPRRPRAPAPASGASTETPGRNSISATALPVDHRGTPRRRGRGSCAAPGSRAADEMIEQAEEERQVGRLDPRFVHRQDEARAAPSRRWSRPASWSSRRLRRCPWPRPARRRRTRRSAPPAPRRRGGVDRHRRSVGELAGQLEDHLLLGA